jgi:hypothetical protein
MNKSLCALAAVGAVGFASIAQADLIGNAYVLTATDGVHTASYPIPLDWLQGSAGSGILAWSQSWNPGSELPLTSPDGTVVAKLAGASCLYVGDPQVSVNFSVLSGASPTTFTISSAVLTFPSGLYSAHGSAGVTLTDLLGDGATITGAFAGGATYEAVCNGTPIADLIPTFAVGSNQTNTMNGAFGPTSYSASSMQASFSFTLTPFDSASGTSVYVKDTIPAPGVGGLLALGGLAAIRRRR